MWRGPTPRWVTWSSTPASPSDLDTWVRSPRWRPGPLFVTALPGNRIRRREPRSVGPWFPARSTKGVSCRARRSWSVSADTGSCRACGRALPQAHSGRTPAPVLLEHLPVRGAACPCARCRPSLPARWALYGGTGRPAMPQARGVHPVRQRGAVPVLFRLLHRDGPVPAGSAHTRLRTRNSRTRHTGQPPAPVPVRTGRKDEEPAQPTRLLLVEDDEAIQEALRLALTLARATKSWTREQNVPGCAAPICSAPTWSCSMSCFRTSTVWKCCAGCVPSATSRSSTSQHAATPST